MYVSFSNAYKAWPRSLCVTLINIGSYQILPYVERAVSKADVGKVDVDSCPLQMTLCHWVGADNVTFLLFVFGCRRCYRKVISGFLTVAHFLM